MNQILNEISSTYAMSGTKGAKDQIRQWQRHNEDGKYDLAIDQMNSRINNVQRYADSEFQRSSTNAESWQVNRPKKCIYYNDDILVLKTE